MCLQDLLYDMLPADGAESCIKAAVKFNLREGACKFRTFQAQAQPQLHVLLFFFLFVATIYKYISTRVISEKQFFIKELKKGIF